MDCRPDHAPVLLDEAIRLLSPAGKKVLVDCTIGLGGHAEALLEAAAPDAVLIALDLDEENLRLCKIRFSPFADRVRLFHANFSELPSVLSEAGIDAADAILADLGVASVQLDDPGRGFSFAPARGPGGLDGPLDMRMDRSGGRTAAELVNSLGEAALADLIYAYGQERYSRRIARAIVAARTPRPIGTSSELGRIVAGAYPPPTRKTRRGVHPATRTFQALRIAVNDEMSNLEKLLEHLPKALKPGGRAAVISFHSLEDRRVKHAFADWAARGEGRLLTKKPITPTVEELRRNPRSRSAKLRGIERIA